MNIAQHGLLEKIASGSSTENVPSAIRAALADLDRLAAVNARLLAACRSAHAGADHADDCWHWTSPGYCNCHLARLRSAIAEAEAHA